MANKSRQKNASSPSPPVINTAQGTNRHREALRRRGGDAGHDAAVGDLPREVDAREGPRAGVDHRREHVPRFSFFPFFFLIDRKDRAKLVDDKNKLFIELELLISVPASFPFPLAQNVFSYVLFYFRAHPLKGMMQKRSRLLGQKADAENLNRRFNIIKTELAWKC